MKRELTAVLLVSSALSGAACSRRQDQAWDAPARYCVDHRTGQRVADEQCAPGGYRGAGVNPFLFYYLGTLNSRTYVPVGGYAAGGGYAPVSGVRYSAAPTVSSEAFSASAPSARGGFGGTAAGEGGGAGE